MPLSDHEQRILQELEQSLYQQDPEFAERVRSESLYRHAGRACKWAALGFIGGLVVLVAFFTVNLVIGLAGFLAMFLSAVVFERNLRRMGQAGWRDLTQSFRSDSLGGTFHETRDWIRSHLHRRD